MPQLFLPEIETLAEENPMMYEILFRIQQAINNTPVTGSGAAPTPQPLVDPVTGLPATDASGNPLSSIPQQSNVPNSTDPLTSSAVSAQENAMVITTDPTGLASGGYIFGGSWVPLWKRISTKDLIGQGASKLLQQGNIVIRGQNDVHGRPPSSFHSNVVDNMSIPLTQPLTQHGTTTQIDVAAFTIQIGGIQISYNSGSVDPGSLGTFTVFFDDPLYRGGSVVFQTTTSGNGTSIAKRGRYFLGQITTAGGGGGTGGGGGSGGGGGPCFTGNTRIITMEGFIPIRKLRPGMSIFTLNGWRRLEKVDMHLYTGELYHIGNRQEWVTPKHRLWIKGEWKAAKDCLDHEVMQVRGVPVFNLQIQGYDDFDHNYALACGYFAHNFCPY